MASQRNISIIVTGGASGIGLGITRYFAPKANTHITILDISDGTAILNQLRAEYPSASLSFSQCDVSSWESQAAAFEKVVAKQGHIDIVFANAGITQKGDLLADIHDVKPSKPELRTLDVNLVGVIYTVKLATHYMVKNAPRESETGLSKGSIICTASNAGIYPFPIAPLYAATKSGVIGLVRSLARSLEREQIQINALAPAVIETNIAPDSALFRSMILTPMSTAARGVEQLVEDASLTGKVLELHGEEVTFAEPPAYVDQDTGTNIEMFWKLGYA
ncbi:bacilysin biosynthesis oxidoreductase BacC [Aspergillus lentulus]|uniref:putative short chain dehydrogenase/reductase n=1 Tax=Aspergillus lentulus TaxID=293939 RepID=UPI0013924AA6|nr:bacilysin biosynthesis oxidoreductase BacC [Aspergillus lentulus]GFF54040.1 bacilysin biosynthesis oxidoreductase BacC [Aspergillus lentulus]GFF60095.1 bacilysin biosynthesis oxidoreductase BacC [Aspergillus lentulus]GFG10645.1 bacilysin biosynthesis oxidoreductase BacC [Aspergillus lentulus]